MGTHPMTNRFLPYIILELLHRRKELFSEKQGCVSEHKDLALWGRVETLHMEKWKIMMSLFVKVEHRVRKATGEEKELSKNRF